jgi:hypothetical protein
MTSELKTNPKNAVTKDERVSSASAPRSREPGDTRPLTRALLAALRTESTAAEREAIR